MPSGAFLAMLSATRWSCMSRNASSAFDSNSVSASEALRMLASIMPVNTASNLSPAAFKFSADAIRVVSEPMPAVPLIPVIARSAPP